MAPFLPVRAISRSQGVRIGGQTVKTDSTTYVDLGSNAVPYTPRKELRSHLALGAVIAVGPLTGSTTTLVGLDSTAGVAEVKAENDKEYEVTVKKGEVKNRDTGAYVLVTKDEVAKKVKAAKTGKEKIDRIEVKDSSGAIKATEGVAAAEGSATLPAASAGYSTVGTVVTLNEKIEATPADLKLTTLVGRP
jgi:hypothetical protein